MRAIETIKKSNTHVTGKGCMGGFCVKKTLENLEMCETCINTHTHTHTHTQPLSISPFLHLHSIMPVSVKNIHIFQVRNCHPPTMENHILERLKRRFQILSCNLARKKEKASFVLH